MKNKITLDDGCNPELVAGAKFDGVLEIPIIEKPSHFIIPSIIVPFSERHRVSDPNAAIGFYEMDNKFGDLLRNPDLYLEDLKRFAAVISPDCSLYRDAPLSVQITNTYKNRAIGSHYQRKGLYVIPQVRWGSDATYTTKLLPERVAFLGIEKHSIVAIGTYGCIQHTEDKYHFKAGLDAMLKALEPEIVLVYGSMPNSVFGDYLNSSHFIQYDNWTKLQHGGND